MGQRGNAQVQRLGVANLELQVFQTLHETLYHRLFRLHLGCLGGGLICVFVSREEITHIPMPNNSLIREKNGNNS